MGNIVSLYKPEITTFRRRQLLDISQVLGQLPEEREKRPELLKLFVRFLLLFANYFNLKDTERIILDNFRLHAPGYLIGSGEGYRIKFFCYSYDFLCRKEFSAPANLARKSRYTYQLDRWFDSFLEGGNELFNNNSLTRENNLVKNITNMNLTVYDIVEIVASARPEILDYYRSPEFNRELRNAIKLT